MFLGDISKSLQWKAILINQIHTIWWQSPQSPNHGPNSFPLLIRISSKLQIAVLSKFWVVACQLKYFKTSLIFAFISIPISLLGLFIVQQDSQNEDKCEILWTWGGCIFLLHTIHFSTAVKCMKYHEYEDDAKYFLRWFTFQPVSPSYCSPDPVTGNLPFDCIDIIDVRESYRVVRDFCHLVNESKLCSLFKRFRFGFHQTLRDTGGNYVISFQLNWTIEIFRNNFLLKIDWIKVSTSYCCCFQESDEFFWGQTWTLSSRSKISTYVHSWP